MASKTAKTINTEVTEVIESNNSATMTPKELAAYFGTDAKSVRKWLRAIMTNKVGKGGHWHLDTSDLEGMRAQFDAYRSSKVTVVTVADLAPAE
jgi:hypothetical protein